VTYINDASILINKEDTKYWIPKSLISVFDTMLSTSGYRLWKFKSLPEWFIEKNEIN
jgi:hypothetical protein